MDKIELDMIQRKKTPGTVVYTQVDTNGKPPTIKSLYLPKWALGADAPEKIHIVITEAK